MAIIIDGKKVSAQVKEQVRIETEELVEKGIKPGLAVIIKSLCKQQEKGL